MRPKCPVCGRLFWCDYPQLWRYKREKVYLCSWGCLRKWDERKEAKEMKILTAEEKRTACEAALRGENPAQYLKGLGVTNVTTSWATVRKWAMDYLNRDDFEKLPEKLGKEKQKVELVYDPGIAEEYRREQTQKEANERAAAEAVEEMNRPKIFREIEMKPLQVCAVKSRAKEGASFTIADNGGMYLCNSTPWLLTKEEWQLFSMEIMVALEQLGIEK